MKHFTQKAFRKFKALFFLSALLLAFTLPAHANQFKYESMSWSRVDGPTNTVKIRVSQAFSIAYFYDNYGQTVVANSIITVGDLNFGDGSPIVPINLYVTSVDVANDFFYGYFEVEHVYPTNGVYTAFTLDCCRFDLLQNNAGYTYINSTLINLSVDSDSPVTTVSPIVKVASGMPAATFTIPAYDPDGDALTYTLAAADGSWGTYSPIDPLPTCVQPPNFSVSTSGVVTFNTIGLTIGNFYNANIVITDSKGERIQVDFIIQITGATPNPPFFVYPPTPANNIVYKIRPGENLTFPVRAQDNDNGDIVTLFANGLPIGATVTPTLPSNGNPVNGTFSWTPLISQIGIYVVNFTATDISGNQVQTSVNINVNTTPQFDLPDDSTFVCAPVGVPVQTTFTASGPEPGNKITIAAISGLKSGMVFSPTIPSVVKTNPITTVLTYTPIAANWGINKLKLKATDNGSDSGVIIVNYVVDRAPVITSSPVTTALVGIPYSYTFISTDADITAGNPDFIALNTGSLTLPSWLTITPAGVGRWTISGTPTAADLGTTSVSIAVSDSLDEFGGCFNAIQLFDITITNPVVTACNLKVSLSKVHPKCYGEASGSITSNVTMASGPVSYLWSPGGATTANLTNVPAGNYTLVVTEVNNPTCKKTVCVTLCAPSKLKVGSICASPRYVSSGCTEYTIYKGYGQQYINLSVNPTGGNAPYTYQWTPSTGLTSPTSRTTKASPNVTTTYTVKVTDSKGCVSYATNTIKVKVVDIRCGGSGNNQKVYICHRTNSCGNPTVQICVSVNAVPAHLQHGDCLGLCEDNAPSAQTTEGEGTTATEAPAVEIISKGKIGVYPNPASDIANLVLNNFTAKQIDIRISNMNGKMIDRKIVAGTGNQQIIPIDLVGKAKGVYLVQVMSDKAVLTTKFVVE